MRLHALTITGFGAYPATVSLDFEELNRAGVFLLSGPTGAGKTTVLDAVCFALYGTVPGGRDRRGLRSDHAAPGTRPLVTAAFSLGDRRFRIERSPEWLRPKKRGEGTTREQSTVKLFELGTSERLISTRADEVGHEMTQLLGMTYTQFMQVVLLPQGQFQTFLLATSEDRERVLAKLFDSRRFESIEGWMAERAQQDRVAAERARSAVISTAATLAHRADTDLPGWADAASASELWSTDVTGSAETWSAELVDQLGRRRAALRRAHHLNTEQLRLMRDQERLVEQSHRAAIEHQQAVTELSAWEELVDAAQEWSDALAAHDAARDTLSFLRAEEQAHAAAVCSRADSEDALARFDARRHLGPGVDVSVAALDAARATLADRRAELQAVEGRERRRAVLESDLATWRSERTEVESEIQRMAVEESMLPSETQRAEADLRACREAASTMAATEHDVARAEERHAAACDLPAARLRGRAADVEYQSACRAVEEAKAHCAQLMSGRISAMAAELAAQLVPGEDCTVCGGREHPRPAPAEPAPITDADQSRAERHLAEATADRDRRHCELLAAAAHLRVLTAYSEGREADITEAELDTARARLKAARLAGGQIKPLEQECRRLREWADSVGARQMSVAADRSRLESRLEAAAEELVEIATTLEPLLGEHDSISRARAVLDKEHSLLGVLSAALQRDQDLQRRSTEAREACTVEVRKAGFDSPAAARAALLGEETRRQWRAALAQRDRDHARLEAVLARPVAPEPVESSAERVSEIKQAVEAAQQRCDDSLRQLSSIEELFEDLRDLHSRLGQVVAEWEPLRRVAETASGLSAVVRGRGQNRHKVPLSSYVLATRLDEVLDAANLRLSQMRDRRYTLHRKQHGTGNRRSGLDLEVLDAWTARTREVSTLSGGELFVASLSLALGLADVVTAEAGGLHMDTLFVDEGFGSLDADTLDDVMDRIDELRAGGRTVGVVSHVTELRDRIPVQVLIDKTDHGSTLRVATLTG